MFTGIVQATGVVQSIADVPAGKRLTIDRQGWQPRDVSLAHGDSICVSGVCLTLVAFDDATLAFDVIPETLRRSSLGRLAVGSRVNLEPSLTPTTPMGGHTVQGHIDGVGHVRALANDDGEWRLTIDTPDALMDYMVPKGSVAIEGVSLTIAEVDDTGFTVALIPTTLELTTLGALKAGDPVNLETDILARTVVHVLRRWQQK